MKKKVIVLLSSLVIMAFSINTVSISDAKVKTMKIGNKKFNVTMQVGDRLKLSPKKSKTKKIKWKSSNKAVASVNSKGIVKAKKKGKTSITVKTGKTKITGKIKVARVENINNSTQIPTITTMPTSVATVIPTFVPKQEVTPTQTPTPTVTPKPKPVVAMDTWLELSVDQESITKNTNIISGEVKSKSGLEVLVEVEVNGVVIAEKVMKGNEDTFSIETDFSGCSVGKDVTISVSCAEGDLTTSEEEEWIISYKVWPAKITYKLK